MCGIPRFPPPTLLVPLLVSAAHRVLLVEKIGAGEPARVVVEAHPRVPAGGVAGAVVPVGRVRRGAGA